MSRPAAPGDAFWSLCTRVQAEGWLVHGSPQRLGDAIEPRRAAGEGEPRVHASDSVLVAFLHGLLKRLQGPAGGGSPGAVSGAAPVAADVRAGCYRLCWPGTGGPAWAFFSVDRATAARLDAQAPVWLHLCPPGPFRLRHRARASRWSAGLVGGASEWTALTPVRPAAAIALHLHDLPCAVALHRRGASHLEAMLRYPVACKLPRA